jgi:putative tryptophan/tyrosine transport system substrate-binding protein
MRRRDFIAGLGSAAALQLSAASAQPRAVPTVGFFHSGSAEARRGLIAVFLRSLAEAGFVEGRNVGTEWRFGDGDDGRLPELASDLVRRGVAVIATPGSAPAALAAKAATATIPIVFGFGSDPVQMGLVESLNRPGANATGYNQMSVEVIPKRLGLLTELLPDADRFGMIVNPRNPKTAEATVARAQAAADIIHRRLDVLLASTDRDIDRIFANIGRRRIEALIFTPDATFFSLRVQIVSLAARSAMPTIFEDRLYVEAGGLVSYGSSVTDMYRQVGSYVGRILKGEKPADMPVLQPTKFELVINLKTAKALGLIIPERLLATADEVFQ